MSEPSVSLNIRVPPEAKRALEREVDLRRASGDHNATMSRIVTEWLLSLGQAQSESKTKR